MLQLRTLGAIELRKSSGEVVRAVLAQPKRLALFVYLATAKPRGFHQKDTLRALFWPDADDHHARHALNRALYFLRNALGENVIVGGRGDSVAVDRHGLWCDAVAFEESLDARRVEEALELYRGHLLTGFFATAAPEFEQWLDAERERLRKRALAAALSLADREVTRGDVSNAARWAAWAAETSPYAEGAVRRLLALLDQGGDRAEAVRVYEAFARRLENDLRVAPSPETAALIEAIRARADTTLAASPPAGRMIPTTPPPLRRWWSGVGAVAALAAIAVVLSVGGLALERMGTRPVRAPTTRVALTPFANAGPRESDYLAAGITEELITRLAKVPGLTVIAPASMSRNAERATEDVRRFAGELGVRAVLHGSVRPGNGRRVRITARLLDARTHETIWAETYDREVLEILDVQTDIASRIAAALAVSVGEETKTQLARRTPRSPDAYVSYLKGRYFLNKRTDEGLNRAIRHFGEAVARDSAYALAYAGLADAYCLLSARGGPRRTDRPGDVLNRGKAFALKAIQLDSTLPEARLSLALLRHWQEWDWEGARLEYARAIRLDTHSAEARERFALLLRDLGQLEEALHEAHQGLELDPLSPHVNRALGSVLFSMGRTKEAIEQLQKTLELEPDFPLVHEGLRNMYADVGRYDEALEEQLRVATLQGWPPEAMRSLRTIYHSMGWPGVLERIRVFAVETSRRQYVSPAVLAARHAQVGLTEDAFRFLEQAYRERDLGLISIKTNPLYRGLRADPRFAELQRRMGLLGG